MDNKNEYKVKKQNKTRKLSRNKGQIDRIEYAHRTSKQAKMLERMKQNVCNTKMLKSFRKHDHLIMKSARVSPVWIQCNKSGFPWRRRCAKTMLYRSSFRQTFPS